MDVILYSKISKVGKNLESFKDGYGESVQIHKNLLEVYEPTSTTDYYNFSNGSLVLTAPSYPTTTYQSYMIPVKENQKYTSIFNLRYACFLREDMTPMVTKTADMFQQVKQVDTTDWPGAKYIAFSIRSDNVDWSLSAFSEGETASKEVITIVQELPGWCEEEIVRLDGKIDNLDAKPKKNTEYVLTDTSFSTEKSFPAFLSSVKGVDMHIVVNLTSFTSVTVGLRTSELSLFYVEVTEDSINLYDYGTGSNARTSTYTHGLTIADNLSIDVYADKNTSNYHVKIASNGNEYTTPSIFSISHMYLCYPYATMDGSASFVQFSATSNWTKPIWVFGDSYLGTFNVSRWAYYLVSRDQDSRVMMDGFGGENSATSLTSLQTLIKSGTPDYIVWCLGMNDGSDSGTTPKDTWLNAVNSVISICDTNNIKLILATIPTVPSVNNEGKNAWVRSSGYQFIDFARSVGASSSGVWFTGMLSDDNVHPTQTGAITLYHAALAGCPQFNQK